MFDLDFNASMAIMCVVVAVALTIAAITDLRQFKVYNVLTFPLIISGILFHAVTPWGEGFGFTLLGVLLGFGLFLRR